MTRSLLFVTGTRADFGKLEPLARAAQGATVSARSGARLPDPYLHHFAPLSWFASKPLPGNG
jgi:hypothetical protein